jgi:hypothetical protein
LIDNFTLSDRSAKAPVDLACWNPKHWAQSNKIGEIMARKKKAPAFEFKPYVPPTVRFHLTEQEGPQRDNQEKYDNFLLTFIKNGGRVMETCAELDISFQLFRHWEATRPNFKEAVLHTTIQMVNQAWDGIMQDMNHPDPNVRDMARKHINKYVAHKVGLKQQENTSSIPTQQPQQAPVININMTPKQPNA